jgi:hypothetical protein
MRPMFQSTERDADVVTLPTPDARATAGGSQRWPPSLDQLLEAERNRRTNSADAEACARYDDLRARYEEAHGEILDLFICKHIEGAGAVLTSKDEIKVRYPADQVAALQPEFEEALWRATALGREGIQLLAGRRRTLLASMVQSVVVYLLGVLDSQHQSLHAANGQPAGSSPGRIERSLAAARSELDRIGQFLRRSAQAVAEKFYLQGMLLGLPVLPLLAWAVGSVQMDGVAVPPLVIAVVAGGVGAVISVMTRISAGKLSLDCHATTALLRLAGFFRPLIGAISGLIIYVVVQAGLVPVTPPTQAKGVYFFTAIAFLAGFSERWAQDMLGKSTAGMPGEADPAPRSSTTVNSTIQAD